MIVLDASAALKLVPVTSAGETAARIVGQTDETLHAPHWIDLEVLLAVLRFIRSDQPTPARAAQALDDFAALRGQRYGYLALAPRLWQLRKSATAYDAAYLTLAEALPETLLTCDAALSSSPGVTVRVEVL